MPNPRISISKVKQDPFKAMLRKSEEGEVKLQNGKSSLDTKEGIERSANEDTKEEATKKTLEAGRVSMLKPDPAKDIKTKTEHDDANRTIVTNLANGACSNKTLQESKNNEAMSTTDNIDNIKNMPNNIGADRGIGEHKKIHGDERKVPKDNKDAKEDKGLEKTEHIECIENTGSLDEHVTRSLDDSGVECLSLPSVSMDDETHPEATLSHPGKYLTRSETYIVPDVLVDLENLDASNQDGNPTQSGLDGRADCLQGDDVLNGDDEAGEAMQNNSNNLNHKPRYVFASIEFIIIMVDRFREDDIRPTSNTPSAY